MRKIELIAIFLISCISTIVNETMLPPRDYGNFFYASFPTNGIQG
jgi:hypothetical protein